MGLGSVLSIGLELDRDCVWIGIGIGYGSGLSIGKGENRSGRLELWVKTDREDLSCGSER